jgi:alpha-tubulin suppressor-like RCC1 family protein
MFGTYEGWRETIATGGPARPVAAVGALLVAIALSVPVASASAHGAVFTWGWGRHGQLGDGTDGESAVPVEVQGLSGVKAVSTSESNDLALLENGTVMSWGGEDRQGELGDGGTGETDVPVAVKGLTGVVAISAGDPGDLALLSDGRVMAWGANGAGQLANGTTSGESTVPVEVPGLSGVVAISTNGFDSLALLSNGTVMAWGANPRDVLGDTGEGTEGGPPVPVAGLSGVTAIATDGSLDAFTSLALLSDGKVMAWGENRDGSLGDGTSTGPEKGVEGEPFSTAPVEVKGLTEVTAIAAGLALRRNGTVMAWGNNSDGELGDGTNTGPEACTEFFGATEVHGVACATVPVEVTGLSGVTTIAAPDSREGSSFALLSNGTVMAWGDNFAGSLGGGIFEGPQKCSSGGVLSEFCSTLPVEVQGLSEVSAISMITAVGTATPLATPGVTAVSPAEGPESGRTTVTITGTNFAPGDIVKFGTASATDVVVNSATSITVTSPAGKGTVDVTVSNGSSTSATHQSDRFTYEVQEAPEYGRCVAVGAGHGSYKTAACDSAQAGGSFEWLPGAVAGGFTISGAKSTLLETAGKTKVTCTAVTGSGAHKNLKAVAGVALTFTGCESLKQPCSSSGAGVGEVATGALEGTLQWQSKAAKKVVLDLYPPGKAGLLVRLECATTSFEVRGSVLVPVPADKMETTTKLKVSASKQTQKPSEYETSTGGKVPDFLETSISGGGVRADGAEGQGRDADRGRSVGGQRGGVRARGHSDRDGDRRGRSPRFSGVGRRDRGSPFPCVAFPDVQRSTTLHQP